MSKTPENKKNSTTGKRVSAQKRKSFRLSAVVDARFTPVGADAKVPVSRYVPVSKWIKGSINDLSEGGLRLAGPLAVGENGHVAISFKLPSTFLKDFVKTEIIKEAGPFGERTRTIEHREPDFQEMEICGRIIQEAFNDEKKNFQYHISFTKISTEILQELRRFITLSQRWQLKHRSHSR